MLKIHVLKIHFFRPPDLCNRVIMSSMVCLVMPSILTITDANVSKFLWKDFYMISLCHTWFMVIKFSKTENAQIYLFCPTDLSLCNLRRNGIKNLLNMKTRSILVKFWDKIVIWPAYFLSFYLWLCAVSNSIKQKKPIPK